MAKKRHLVPQCEVAGSVAYAVLSNEGKSLLETLPAFGREEILVEERPGRFVKVKPSDKSTKFGTASSENIAHARRIVDLAEAAFEAERATEQ
jgi:hypothetical protein